MGLIRDTLKDVKGSVFGDKDKDKGRHRTSDSGQGYAQHAVSHDGAFIGTPEHMFQAYNLVASAVQDLTQASESLHKKGGLIAAGKEGFSVATGSSEATWGQVGKTVGHDGRGGSVDLVSSAHTKYEQAAELVEGLPEIEVAGISQSKIKEAATSLGGATAGSAAGGVVAAGLGAASIASSVMGMAPVGLIKKIVKKKRIKKSTESVDGMLAEYKLVLQQLHAQMH